MSFVHLHVHSEYSLLDGLGHPHQIVARAKELNQPAVALTDHGVMYGVIDFYNAAKTIGIKPIVGMEGYLARRSRHDRDPQKDKSPYHLLLLAQDDTGYKNLLQLATLAQLEGFYYKPRVDKDSLAQFSQGLIVTTGCGSSEVPRLIQNGQIDQARETLAWYVDVFGRDRFFIELQLHEGIPELPSINRQLLAFARDFGLKAVATNDVHFIRAENARAQDVLLCIGTGSLVSEPDRMKMTDTSYYLKSAEEMAALFGDVPDALSNTLLVAEMCSVDLDPKGYHLPEFPVPDGHTPETYLRQLCEAGLVQRYGLRANDPVIRQRLDYELSVIHQMGFDTYFLIVGDLTRYAREQGIWWNVRGSAAGSIVAYTAGITLLDPLQHGLIFERFLNPDRISMPDIDLDFPDDRRAEMIEYAVQRYGRDKVAQIVTFGTLGARAAIRDVGRAMDVPLNDVDHIAKLVPAIPGKPITIREAVEQVPELKVEYESKSYVRDLLDAAVEVEGTARNVGTHAAGVIISDKPLVEYVPLHRPTKGDDASSLEAITQFEMGACEAIGLLKVDFLGLSTLTIMRKACDLIEQRHGDKWTLDTIPTDDPAAFELMARGDVSGIFQVEGEGMRRVLTEMKPKKFEHIVATISLFRPGPIEYIPTYIRRLHGDEPVEYKHPALEPILAETYGICVSGDAIVIDARTGRPYRLDEVNRVPDMLIQGVDENWQPAVGRVTRWIDSGYKPVYRVTLRNGSHLKVTADHRLLIEAGWRSLRELQAGDYVATPPFLFGPDKPVARSVDRRRLRALAYLIADGSLSSMAAADFISKDPALLEEYERCLSGFDDVRPTRVTQVRGVTRLGVAKAETLNEYHAPNSLLTWLRELGLKAPPGSRPGGLRSHEKFIYPKGQQRDRISTHVVMPLVEAIPLPETNRKLGMVWEKIVSIESVGVEHVYDLTVEGLHSFVANNIIVHNCVYQEQIIEIAKQLAGYSLPEADEMRKAVGKKIKEKIDAHRAKFVKGAVKNGIEQSTAEAIYGDIEFFARYGFNKAHAADYAVITCQTAFLKARYPVEYMTALMTVERNNTEKVGYLIVEARRMSLDVLPPDVTRSRMDFAIEPMGEREAIRYGLGAIKNVGEAPVRAILEARESGGPFRNLDDFCRRVDLRQVNRRALEALIKVGAFEPFGLRAQLLASIDKMLGSSSAAHRAADVGQMSLFGALAAHDSVSTLGALPSIEEAPLRERLEWEKELIGVYVSEHPVARALAGLHGVISHQTTEIAEEHHDQKVTLLGLVAGWRTTQTKKGETMAFVTLEDVQGTIDVVVFPRTWKQTQPMWQRDTIVVVRGKVDARGRKPSIICDTVSDTLNVTRPADGPKPRVMREPQPTYSVSKPRPEEQGGQAAAPDNPVAAEPPLPDAVPAPVSDGDWPRPAVPAPEPRSAPPAARFGTSGPGFAADRSAPRHLRVTIERTGDGRADARRVGEAHRVLQSFSGHDRFSFYVTGGSNGGYEFEFPNDTTLVCDELLARLRRMFGPQAVNLVE